MRTGLFVLFLVWSGVAIGCGDDDSKGSGGSGGDGEVVALQGSNRCANRAGQCGVQASIVASRCNPICDQQPTETELHCIETTDCAELTAAWNGAQQKCGLQFSSADGG